MLINTQNSVWCHIGGTKGIRMETAYLQHNLWNMNWVSRWAGTSNTSSSELLRSSRRIGNVGLVVRTVEVHSIPAAISELVLYYTAENWINLRWI